MSEAVVVGHALASSVLQAWSSFFAATPTGRTAAQGVTPGQDPPAGTAPTSTLASVGRSALVLTGSMAASQAVIVIRELFVAAQTGASASLDALLVGIALPTAMGGVLTAGTTVAFVPAYMSAMSKGGPRAAQKFAGYVLSWSAVVSLFLALGLVAFADEVVAIAGSGLTQTGPSRRRWLPAHRSSCSLRFRSLRHLGRCLPSSSDVRSHGCRYRGNRCHFGSGHPRVLERVRTHRIRHR